MLFFIFILSVCSQLWSHIWKWDQRLSNTSQELVKDYVSKLDGQKFSFQPTELPFISSLSILKKDENSFYIAAHAQEPVCLIEIIDDKLKRICVRCGLVLAADFYSDSVVNSLPKVKASQLDGGLKSLATLPDFCLQNYKIEWYSPEKIFFIQSNYKVLASVARPLTLDIERKIEEKLNNLVSKKKPIVFDIRFADQIILKGRQGHG